MTWPNATDYNAAVQNPQLCFRDDDLRQGQAVGDLFGLPRPHSGSFADVYQIQTVQGQSWAVKCFTRPVTGLQARYQAISEHLRQAQRAFMVEFHFLDEGISVGGLWYPLLKMRWVEGFRLNEFIRDHLNKPIILDRLAQLWVRLAQELREAGMAHGDLQHGNVLLVPASNGSSLALKLIDYDGMFVPALADRPSGEYGHPNYQHPRRQAAVGYNLEMDRFSLLVIYTALRCLRIGGEELWQRYDNQENLLFREDDFLQPGKSRLLHELWKLPEREVRDLAGHLLLASQGPLETVPRLDQLIEGNVVQPLTSNEECRINDLLKDSAHESRAGRAIPPPLPRSRSSIRATRMTTRTIARSVDQTVDTVAPTDSTSIRVSEKNSRALPPPLPPTFRRSAAEIELDAEPPTDAAAPASRLSRAAWLAALFAIGLIGVSIAWFSTEEAEPPTVIAIRQPAVEKVEEKPLPPAVRQPPQLSQPKAAQKSAKLAAVPQVARTPAQSQLRIEKPRVRLQEVAPTALSVEAGTKGALHVLLDRNGYTGRVEIQLADLPANVTAPLVALPAPQSSATVQVAASIDAAGKEYSAKLIVRVDNQTVDIQSVTLSVRKPRARREKVQFRTVDHMQLAGTLYHGWKAKRGITVLMLHDLGTSRSSPGWKRLAEALQAEGHTVLTFDFRGHGESTRVSPPFWKHSVNQSMPAFVSILPVEKQRMRLELADLPFEYRPWLVEDIAAARTFLDMRSDEPAGPVNTFNLVVIGAGQAAALGSLWLATEGLRYNGSDTGNKILLRWEEKRSVLQAVWLGMADPIKLSPFGIHSWLEAAHAAPIVPITFIHGEADIDTSTLLSLPIRKKFGHELVLRGARQSGQKLLDTDEAAFLQIHKYLVKTFASLPPPSPSSAVNWAPRNIKSLRSLWRLESPGRKRQVRWFVAKRAGDEQLAPVPFPLLGIPIKGLGEPSHFTDEEDQ